ILGPVFARMQSEFLEPLLNRCFQLALRDGSFGPIPQELLSMNVDIIPEYISPNARAQRIDDVTALERFEQSLAQSSQLNPGVLDVYDFELAQRKKAFLLGVPADVIRSKEQLIKLRNEQAEAQAQEKQEALQSQMVSDPRMVKNGLDAVGGAEGIQQLLKAA
ncbi:portal protein, partial [Methylomonas koyamae]